MLLRPLVRRRARAYYVRALTVGRLHEAVRREVRELILVCGRSEKRDGAKRRRRGRGRVSVRAHVVEREG